MYAIAYFIATTTCLSGATSFKRLFGPNQYTNDESSKLPLNESSANPGILSAKGVMKPSCGLTAKKPVTKKPNAPLIKAEKKELQMNNFYQNAKRTR